MELSLSEKIIIRDSLIEYYQNQIKYSKNEKLKKEVFCLKEDFKRLIK